MRHPLASLFALAFAIAQTLAPVHARVLEEQMDVPVKVTDIYGKLVEHTIKVTVFSDNSTFGPSPVLVFNHGRAAEPEDRARMGRARFTDASRFFVQRDFVVAVPTRVGYGVTGGEDVEYTGTCNRKNYPPAYAAAAAQTLAVLDAVRSRPDAAKDRAVVVGQSFGGATAVTIASLNPPGVQASINFAGGGGGNPKTQPQQPCAPQLLERLFSVYGEAARIPMLWVYTENDQYFGPTLPRQWFDAFVKAGGKGEFTQFSAQPEDGHQLFIRHPELWQPRVATFLDGLGFKAPPIKGQ